MAKVMNGGLPPTKRTTLQKYAWSEWTDGEAWLLVRGEDYTLNDEAMRAIAHVTAKRRGLTVRTRVSEEGLVVQFSRPEPEPVTPLRRKKGR